MMGVRKEMYQIWTQQNNPQWYRLKLSYFLLDVVLIWLTGDVSSNAFLNSWAQIWYISFLTGVNITISIIKLLPDGSSSAFKTVISALLRDCVISLSNVNSKAGPSRKRHRSGGCMKCPVPWSIINMYITIYNLWVSQKYLKTLRRAYWVANVNITTHTSTKRTPVKPVIVFNNQ